MNLDEFDQISSNQQGFLKHLLQKPVANLRKPYGSTIQEVKNGEIADVDMDASNADDFDKDDMDGSFGSDGFDADDFDDLGDSDN